MSIHLIIDGYNLIRQSAWFSPLDQQDLQQGREALLKALAEYRKVKPHRITVVFDGSNAPPLTPNREAYRGIRVRFSRQGELADAVIKRMAARDREKAVVVSSDGEVAAHAQAHGATSISSDDFEVKMAMAVHQEHADDSAETSSSTRKATTRKKGPSHRLSRKKRRTRQKMRKL